MYCALCTFFSAYQRGWQVHRDADSSYEEKEMGVFSNLSLAYISPYLSVGLARCLIWAYYMSTSSVFSK